MFMTRMAWPDYFMSIAHLVAERSTCLRRKVGAIAVKDKRIVLKRVACASGSAFLQGSVMKSARVSTPSRT